MGSNDSDEIAKYIDRIFEDEFGDSENAPRLVGTGVVALSLSESVRYHDQYGESWKGLLAERIQTARGAVATRIACEGNVASQLEPAPLCTKLYAGVVQPLKDDSREDLNV